MKLTPNSKKINFPQTFLLIMFIFIDQIIKYLSINVFDYYVFNQGISFGLLSSNSGQFWLAASALLILVYLVLNNKINLYYLLLIAGGLSNIIDRLLYGAVVDYINFFGIVWFNLADCYINIGIILIVLTILFDISHKADDKKGKSPRDTKELNEQSVGQSE